jgi:hypothetical protein
MDPSQKPNPYVAAGIVGSLSGAASHLLVHPLDVIKTRQQTDGGSVVAVSRALFQEGGVAGFYRGVTPQVLRSVVNGLWVWPAKKRSLEWQQEHTSLPPAAQHVVTGTAVAGVTVCMTNPLDKTKIDLMMPGKPKVSFRELLANGWKGIGTNWANTAVNYSTFLVAQKYFQKTTAPSPHQKLEIGTKVAAAITVASTATDVLTTHRLGKGRSLREVITKNPPTVFLRGIVPAFVSRILRNTISANVMQWLGI